MAILFKKNKKILYKECSSLISYTPAVLMGVDSFIYRDKVKLKYLIFCEAFGQSKNIILQHILPDNVQIVNITAPVGYKIINQKIIFNPYPSLPSLKNYIRYEITCKIISPTKGKMKYTTLLSHDGDGEIIKTGITE